MTDYTIKDKVALVGIGATQYYKRGGGGGMAGAVAHAAVAVAAG